MKNPNPFFKIKNTSVMHKSGDIAQHINTSHGDCKLVDGSRICDVQNTGRDTIDTIQYRQFFAIEISSHYAGAFRGEAYRYCLADAASRSRH